MARRRRGPYASVSPCAPAAADGASSPTCRKEIEMDTKVERPTSNNPDPITGAPGAHPVGTGIGAALGGAAAGAATGTVAGPVGTVVGAAVGAVLGGLAGKGVAETIDPTAEDAFWRDNYKTRPYVDASYGYDDYGPAYAYGVNAYTQYPGRSF